MFDRITFDPKIMGGQACIRGMRIPVSVIVRQIAHGAGFEEILEGYPDLELEDIQQALNMRLGLPTRKCTRSRGKACDSLSTCALIYALQSGCASRITMQPA
jgi:uncharacterized protein (DUF433 family)